MKKFLVFLLSSLLLCSSGCVYSDAQIAAMCSEQYAFGYSFGHEDGYEEGYEVGSSEGYEKGYDQGLSEGYLSGKADGYASGYETGSEEQNESAEPQNIVYIGNKNSQVLHLPTCGSLPKSDNRVYYENIQDALSDGYRPCSGCMKDSIDTDTE